MTKWLLRSFMAVAVAATLTLPAQASGGPASAVVESFHASLLGVMKQASSLGYKGRYDTLAPVVEKVFHLTIMTRIIAGRHWKKFSDTEKTNFVRAFARMTKSTYARRFDGYGGETFRVVEEVPVRKNTLLVKSELVKSDGEIIKLNYMMRKIKDEWRVIDVHLKGSYSELATKRSEYSSVLRREGVGALITRLNGKVAMYEREAGKR